MKILITILLLLTNTICLFGQMSNDILQHFSTKDGLPSNTVYTCTQDDRGFLWFATESGISRFDGKEFKNYGLKDGLKSQASYGAHFYKGIVMAISFKGIDIIKDDSVVNEQYQQLNVTKCNALLFSGLINKHYIMANYDSVFVYDTTTLNLVAKYISNDPVIAQKYWSLHLFYTYQVSSIQQNYLKYPYYYYHKKGSVATIFSYDTSSKKLVKSFEITLKYAIRGAAFIQTNRIYICCADGLYVYSIQNKQLLYETTLLKGKVVNTVFEDREANIWINTDREGVFLLKKHNVSNNFFLKLEQANSVARIGHALAFGCHQDYYVQLEGNKIFTKKTPYHSSEVIVWNYDTNRLAVYSKPYLYDAQTSRTSSRLESIKAFCPYNKDTVLIGESGAGTFFSLKQNKRVGTFFSDRVSALLVSADKTIWIGSYQGLYQYTSDKKLIKYNLKEYSDIIVNAIAEDAYHHLWVSTRGAGILVLNLKDNRITKLQQKNGLQSNDNSKIVIDSKNRKWILSSQGVLMIDEHNAYHSLSENEMLPSNDVSDILVEQDTAWISSKVGIYKYVHTPISQVPRSIPLNITNIQINDKVFKDFPKELNPSQTKIKLSIVGIYYAGIKDIQYRYRLIRNGIERHWELTDMNTIEFNDLKNGDYTLEIQAFHIKYPAVKSLVHTSFFSIRPHYYEQFSFWAIIFIFLLSIISMIIYWMMRANKHREIKTAQLKAKLNEFTLKGLQGQMNPHFVFNSLCTMQHLIANENEEDVRNYLVDFSRLVRDILEHSRNETHSLQDEIVFLKNYIQLEKIRYKNSFDTLWNVEIETDEIEDIYIPTMLVQPVVENAIKHGVFNTKADKGLIQISINLKTHHLLQISVKDNGSMPVLQQSKHNSVALKIIQERLSMYSKNKTTGHFELIFTPEGAVANMLIPV